MKKVRSSDLSFRLFVDSHYCFPFAWPLFCVLYITAMNFSVSLAIAAILQQLVAARISKVSIQLLPIVMGQRAIRLLFLMDGKSAPVVPMESAPTDNSALMESVEKPHVSLIALFRPWSIFCCPSSRLGSSSHCYLFVVVVIL